MDSDLAKSKVCGSGLGSG